MDHLSTVGPHLEGHQGLLEGEESSQQTGRIQAWDKDWWGGENAVAKL